MWTVEALTIYHTKYKWDVAGQHKAREYAKRIITEGLWYIDGKDEVFLPVHQIQKVKIYFKRDETNVNRT